MTDQELLAAYVKGDEGAFGEVVGRHKDWIYSSCLRRLGDRGLAEDATQAVLIALARKARGLSGHRALTGWLYRAAKFTALNMRKSRKRRAAHEAEVGLMVAMENGDGSEKAWGEVVERLEPALDRLPEKYRVAVLLRFYQKKTHGEIGEMLGITEESARKRVARGVEKLRGAMGAAEVAGGSGALGVMMLTHCVQTAPAGVSAAAAVKCAAAGNGAGWSVSTGVLKMMYLAKVKTVVLGVGMVLLTGAVAVTVVAERGHAAAAGVAATGPATTIAAAGDPVDVMRGINRVFAEAKGEELATYIDTGDEGSAAVVKAMQERMTLVVRLRKVMAEKGIGEKDIVSVSTELTGGVPFKEREIATAAVQVDGDTAVITRPDDPGKPMMVSKVDGKWKLDLRTALKGDLKVFAKRLSEQNPLLEEIVGKVAKGEVDGMQVVKELDKETAAKGLEGP